MKSWLLEGGNAVGDYPVLEAKKMANRMKKKTQNHKRNPLKKETSKGKKKE